jgi:acyl carrier protein
MSREELLKQLAEAMTELFDTPAEDVTLESRLYEDLDIDSIDTMDLILKLKQIKQQTITPEMFQNARTVADVIDVLENLD